MIQKMRLLSVNKNSFEKNGQTIEFVQIIARLPEGQIVRYSANKDFDFTPYVDKDVDADVSLQVSADLKPRYRIVGIPKK